MLPSTNTRPNNVLCDKTTTYERERKIDRGRRLGERERDKELENPAKSIKLCDV